MKILIIYATAGAGHRKAAEALHNGFKSSSHEAILTDSLDYTSRFYKSMYSGTYTFLISKIPKVWGFVFALLDIPILLPVVRLIRRIQNTIHGLPLNRYLTEENFDYIISTHFFPTEVAAYLKRKRKIHSKIITVITDYDVHSIWLAQGVDYYTVASDWTKEKIKKLGVAEGQVAVTGIPTDEKFGSYEDIPALKQKLGLKDNVFTVLVATGSFGIGPIEEIIEELAGLQIIVVCGHNKSLYERLSQQKKELVKVNGLVNNMDELMAVADAMVTKPGGLSISEALVSHLALIFFNAIPGQEANNVKVLKTYGVGISDCSIPEIAQILNRYKSSPEELQSVKEKNKALAKPSAVKDIISLIQ